MNNKNNLRFTLIFLGPYPKGNVSTIRIHSYCKALVKKGCFVRILLLAPTKEASVNIHKKGVFEGVHYQYITDITWRNESPFTVTKIFYYLLGLLKSFKYIRQDDVDCLLSYHSNPISNTFFYLVTRLLSIPFILDKTEYPKSYQNNSKIKHVLDRFFLGFYDGFVVISNELNIYYSQINRNVYLLPMTIDIDRFKHTKAELILSRYIAVVFGTHNRDGLLESIKAYKNYIEISNTSDNFRLKLIGKFNGLSNQNEIMEYIKTQGLSDKIDCMGLVDIDEVPQILANASCLLTTPNSYKSGGFPTKLGEYMLSGVPVITTSAGEIDKYVIHKHDVLLSKPGDIADIALNLSYIQKNPDAASILAKNAYQTVLKKFNADNYSDDLINFVRSLIKS